MVCDCTCVCVVVYHIICSNLYTSLCLLDVVVVLIGIVDIGTTIMVLLEKL